jgi:hypothetical protein
MDLARAVDTEVGPMGNLMSSTSSASRTLRADGGLVLAA